MSSTTVNPTLSSRAHQFYQLTKPRVVYLIVFTAIIGMLLAVPGIAPLQPFLAGTVGIALVAGAAAAMNCLVEQKIDAIMARTRARPLPRGQLTSIQTLIFSGIVGGIGLAVLYHWVNALTMWLTLATFVGYAVIYTVILKPMTPQNIVIGGAAGAFPPMIGWAAVTGTVSVESIVLFMIIFMWTPPHFWALALYRSQEYAKVGVPMLPVVAGRLETCKQILIYTVIMIPVTLAPWLMGFASVYYGVSAAVLGLIFAVFALRVWQSRNLSGENADRPARHLFAYSILYLMLLFTALLAEGLLNMGSGA